MRNLTEPLSQEGRTVLQRLPAFEKALEDADPAGLHSFARFLARIFDHHRHVEDDVLLPVLMKHLEREGTPAAHGFVSRPPEDTHWSEFQGQIREEVLRLRTEHEWLAEVLARFSALLESPTEEEELRATGRRLADLLRSHLAAEIDRFYPITERLLTDAEKQGLRIKMAERRR